jgi:hypothetical protein
MGWPVLRLTPEELKWNDYYDASDGRRGVLAHALTTNVTLNAANPAASSFTVSSRRSRVYAITFTGDVTAARVRISSGTGEQYFGVNDPCHIPLLCGGSPHSTLNQGAPFPALYPSAAAGATATPHAAREWLLEIEPNIVLPGAKQLQFAWDLENPNDPSIAGQTPVTYEIEAVVHLWEFPRWRGQGQ